MDTDTLPRVIVGERGTSLPGATEHVTLFSVLSFTGSRAVRIKRPAGAAVTPGAARVRKNMDMDPAKLEAARSVLGAASDTETVDLALAFVASQGRMMAALEGMAADGGLGDVYTAPSPRRVARVSERPRKR